MRWVKFRAWYKPKNVMLTDVAPYEWCIGFDGKIYDTDTSSDGLQMNDDSDDMILMQFTGLTDKNGKEIYEGDIVRMVGCRGGYYNNPDCNLIIRDVCTNGLFADGYHSDGKEVIGNVYENPDLIPTHT